MLDHAPSYYLATAKELTERPPLGESLTCDVCVIGGGLTGLSSTLHLAERGYDVVLLEAQRLAWGASGRNGGQLGSGQRKDPQELAKLLGPEAAAGLWKLAEEAKDLVRGRIARHNIDCDLKPGIMHVAYKPGDVAELTEFAEDVTRNHGYDDIEVLSKAEVAERLGTEIYHGGTMDWGAAHLHPLNYALGLAKAAEDAGARLFEGTAALSVDQGQKLRIRTGRDEVTADFAVLACNGYLEKLEPRIASRIMPINNFVLATEPLGEDGARALIRDDVAVADSKFVIDYYRLSADHRLLFGGGENYRRGFPNDLKSFVRKYMLRVYPQLAQTRIDYAWGGTLAVTVNRLPDFGRLGDNIYYAQGFSGHGLALTSLAGKVIAEALAGQAERFDLMASMPTYRFPGGTLLRWPGMVLGMFYYSLRDKL